MTILMYKLTPYHTCPEYRSFVREESVTGVLPSAEMTIPIASANVIQELCQEPPRAERESEPNV